VSFKKSHGTEDAPTNSLIGQTQLSGIETVDETYHQLPDSSLSDTMWPKVEDMTDLDVQAAPGRDNYYITIGFPYKYLIYHKVDTDEFVCHSRYDEVEDKELPLTEEDKEHIPKYGIIIKDDF